jgi:hypothetical protein
VELVAQQEFSLMMHIVKDLCAQAVRQRGAARHLMYHRQPGFAMQATLTRLKMFQEMQSQTTSRTALMLQ